MPTSSDDRPTGRAVAPRLGRVLLVSHFYPPHLGGIENVVAGQAERLVPLAQGVAVVTSACGGSAGRTLQAGVDVRRVRAWNGLEARRGVPFPVFSPTIVATLWRAVRGAEVVHIHDVLYGCAWVAALCCLLRGRPYVVTQHVSLVDHPSRLVRGVQWLVYATVGALVLRGARRVFVLNGRVAEFVVRLGVAGDRVHLLPNAVDGAQFRPPVDAQERQSARARFGLPLAVPIALFVGRFVPKKGFDVVVAATDRRYLVAAAGAGSEQDEDRGTATPGFVVLGALDRTEVAMAYRAADVFVLPSRGEGFPLTVQEAMASGLPIVLTDDPAYACYGLDRRLVRFVAPDADSVRAALVELAGDGDLRARMSRYSVAVAEASFSWAAHLTALTRGYRDALGQA